MNERVKDFEKPALNVEKCIPNTPLPEDLALSFYSVMSVPGIQTMSLKDS
jgi:hypothetical protein